MSSRRTAAAAAVIVAAAALLLLIRDEPARDAGRWLREQGLEQRYLRSGDQRVHWVAAGSGPPVVLIHGFAASIFTWRDVIPGLAERHRVVALDLPGFGGSDRPPDLSLAHLQAAVGAVLDALAPTPAVLVGSSLGGAVAASVAAARPERVSHLVLIDAAGFQEGLDTAPALVRWASSEAVGVLLERLPGKRLLVRAGLRQVFHDPSRVTRERVEGYLAPLQRPGTLGAWRSLLRHRQGAESLRQLRAAIGTLRVPTLVIWGRQDGWIPVAHADRFAAAIPGARVEILDPCGHLPQEERPRDVLRLLQAFLGPRAPSAAAGPATGSTESEGLSSSPCPHPIPAVARSPAARSDWWSVPTRGRGCFTS